LTSLVEHPGGNCAFFRRGQGCAVYAQRPRQCRTWPFWRRIIVSPEAWNEEAQGCPGMDHGALHDAGTIASTAENDGLRW
jgi:Fe-S-cluster containining protein